jgi:hypothetical protein
MQAWHKWVAGGVVVVTAVGVTVWVTTRDTLIPETVDTTES